MDSTPDSVEAGDAFGPVVEWLEKHEYEFERPLAEVLRVEGRFSNTERIALQAVALAEGRIGVWAISHHNDWTLVCWQRPDLVTITQRGETPQRWRHRRLPEGLQPDAQTFLEGTSSPFDIVTKPKHRPTDEAREVLSRFDLTEPAPPDWIPPVVEAPPVVTTTVPATDTSPRRTTTRAPKPPKPVKAEPTIVVCPNCFMAIPATGICDNCG